MCGICGIFTPGQAVDSGILARMNDALAHRGPDDHGLWRDDEAGIGLAQRRLAILDLSPLGHQPMLSACGRYALTFNGEVFNHLELRRELEPAGHCFRGGSDTETILAAIAHWGLEPAVSRFVGMFALALWDDRERTLSLVRDRLGIKPLYLGRVPGGAVFGSELKALRRHPGFDPGLDRDALALYFRHNYIPAPHSIYTRAEKVLPGQIVSIGPGGESRTRYWNVAEIWRAGAASPFAGSEAEATDELERLLADAVRLRLLADVPLGAFLSGGIDSSTVVALMQKHSARPVKTFSIGFAEAAFNEAPHARAVAAHLGCEHTELTVSPADLLAVVPEIPRHWDEPFADSSQIPTYILSRLTRQHVTVSLSGDGGDELFSGYERYPWALRAHRMLSRIPAPLRRATLGLARLLPDAAYGLLGARGHKLRWRVDALAIEDFRDLYWHAISHFKDPARFVLGAREPGYEAAGLPPLADKGAWMSLVDLLCYLPDDILTKVDRASMAVALEARVPLLDHRVVEFAARVPAAMKVRGGQGKWLLRQVLYRHVPRALVERPKMGFGVPIAAWLRGELRQWADDLLSPAAIRRQGYLDAGRVERMWREYLAGEDNWNYYLWDVLMFQAWLEMWGKPD